MAHILLVDDDTINQRVMKHILKKTPHTVTAASSAAEALEILDKHVIDLSIFDIAMPEMDGIALFDHVQQSLSYEMQVVFLTASGSDEDRLRALRSGAAAFLTKPTSSSQILSTIEKLLGTAPDSDPNGPSA